MFQTPELDIATEVYELLFTDKDCSPINSPYIWRRFNRKENGRKENCPACNPEGSVYVEGQKSCPYCLGYGYTFNDTLIQGYTYKASNTRDFGNLWMKEPIGTSDVSRYLLFTDKSILIGLEDRILIPTLNDSGMIQIPLLINETCKCIYSRYYRASNNKSDFNFALLGG